MYNLFQNYAIPFASFFNYFEIFISILPLPLKASANVWYWIDYNKYANIKFYDFVPYAPKLAEHFLCAIK